MKAKVAHHEDGDACLIRGISKVVFGLKVVLLKPESPGDNL
jgi:hypothetical protein